MTPETVFSPVGRVRPAKAIHRLLHAGEAQIVGVDLDDGDDDIDVVEEAQVDMRDVERNRGQRRGGFGVDHLHLGHVGAAEDADRRLGRSGRSVALAFAIEEAPHVGEKGDELAVMPLLELTRVAIEFIPHLGPRMAAAGLFEQLPWFLNLRTLADWQQLQWPDDDLAEMANALDFVGLSVRHGPLPKERIASPLSQNLGAHSRAESDGAIRGSLRVAALQHRFVPSGRRP